MSDNYFILPPGECGDAVERLHMHGSNGVVEISADNIDTLTAEVKRLLVLLREAAMALETQLEWHRAWWGSLENIMDRDQMLIHSEVFCCGSSAYLHIQGVNFDQRQLTAEELAKMQGRKKAEYYPGSLRARAELDNVEAGGDAGAADIHGVGNGQLTAPPANFNMEDTDNAI